jgi:hypothetical protein
MSAESEELAAARATTAAVLLLLPRGLLTKPARCVRASLAAGRTAGASACARPLVLQLAAAAVD